MTVPEVTMPAACSSCPSIASPFERIFGLSRYKQVQLTLLITSSMKLLELLSPNCRKRHKMVFLRKILLPWINYCLKISTYFRIPSRRVPWQTSLHSRSSSLPMPAQSNYVSINIPKSNRSSWKSLLPILYVMEWRMAYPNTTSPWPCAPSSVPKPRAMCRFTVELRPVNKYTTHH